MGMNELKDEMTDFQEAKSWDFKPGQKVRVDAPGLPEVQEGLLLRVCPNDGLIINAEVAVKSRTKTFFEWDVLQFWVGHLSIGPDDPTWWDTHDRKTMS